MCIGWGKGPVTEMQQDRTDMPSHLLSLEKKSYKF